MNIPNLQKLLKHLQKQQNSRRAARFNMKYWGDAHCASMSGVLKKPVCKTQACLAGETVLALGAAEISAHGGLVLFSNPFGSIEKEAAQLLELDDLQRTKLFKFKTWTCSIFSSSGNGWPVKFETAYEKAKTPSKRLGVAIQRLKHFIKTDGTE